MSTLLWSPASDKIPRLQISLFQDWLQERGFKGTTYTELHEWSIKNFSSFWNALWDFFKVKGYRGETLIKVAKDFKDTSFFPEASLNYTENIFALPMGMGVQDSAPAIIYWCEETYIQVMTWGELKEEVRRLAWVLKEKNIRKGDRVGGFLPSVPQAVIGALATASLGAIWSSCSPDFGIQGVVDRLGQITPKVLLTTEGYRYKGVYYSLKEKVNGILEKVPSITHTVVVPYQKGESVSFGACYKKSLEQAPPGCMEFEQVPFNHPLFILYSSGTTGAPKCMVHGHGGTLLQHLKEHRLHCDMRPHDRVFYYTTTGWMMWNWLLSALGSGATICLYDGNPLYPDLCQIFRFAAAERITHLGTSAKYIELLHKENQEPYKQFDLKDLRVVLSTGSPLGSESFKYVYRSIKKDVQLSSISGGTDILSCFLLGNPLLPVYSGQLQCAGLGMDVQVFDHNGKPLAAGKGELVCCTPFPSKPVAFWDDKEGTLYHKAYFERFAHVWYHGDYVERTAEGGYLIHGRSDAVLNPGGVRIGTAEIYRQVEKIPQILESVVVGQEWKNDIRVILFVKLAPHVILDQGLKEKISFTIRQANTARHVPAKIIAVADIPKTVNGKIVELAVTHTIHGRPIHNLGSLANPQSLQLFKDLKELEID